MAYVSKASIPVAPASTPFPLTLCLAATITAGLGLSASALNVQWGAEPPSADALRLAWPYINLALVAVIFLVWPATVLNDPRASASLLWHLPAIALATTPALALAAWLSSVDALPLLHTLTLQASFALFMLGLLNLRNQSPARQTAIATVGVLLVLVLPLLAYLQLEFLGHPATLFPLASPPLALLSASPSTWWTAAVYALLGSLLLALPAKK